MRHPAFNQTAHPRLFTWGVVVFILLFGWMGYRWYWWSAQGFSDEAVGSAQALSDVYAVGFVTRTPEGLLPTSQPLWIEVALDGSVHQISQDVFRARIQKAGPPHNWFLPWVSGAAILPTSRQSYRSASIVRKDEGLFISAPNRNKHLLAVPDRAILGFHCEENCFLSQTSANEEASVPVDVFSVQTQSGPQPVLVFNERVSKPRITRYLQEITRTNNPVPTKRVTTLGQTIVEYLPIEANLVPVREEATSTLVGSDDSVWRLRQQESLWIATSSDEVSTAVDENGLSTLLLTRSVCGKTPSMIISPVSISDYEHAPLTLAMSKRGISLCKTE